MKTIQHDLLDRDQLMSFLGKHGFVWCSGSCQKSFFMHDSQLKDLAWSASVEFNEDNRLVVQLDVDIDETVTYLVYGFCSINRIEIEEVM